MLYIDESWIFEEDDRLETIYKNRFDSYIKRITPDHRRKEFTSGLNRINRMHIWSASFLSINPKPGDICFIDFGQAFINEAGYQHFGLVISESNFKLFVVPMTSNKETVQKSQEDKTDHLHYIGQIKGLHRPSVLFLNDSKYINSSRVISINAHINTKSKVFLKIKERLKETIFGDI